MKAVLGEPRALGPWLADNAVRESVEALWASGYWIPQESLGLDALLKMLVPDFFCNETNPFKPRLI